MRVLSPGDHGNLYAMDFLLSAESHMVDNLLTAFQDVKTFLKLSSCTLIPG